MKNAGNYNWTDDSGDGIKEPLLDVSSATLVNPVLIPGSGGVSGSFSAVLSDGTHTITASATDSGGLAGSASITVVVQPAVGDTVTVADLAGSSSTINKNFWKVTVVVTINPALGGAVVTGAWSSGAQRHAQPAPPVSTRSRSM